MSTDVKPPDVAPTGRNTTHSWRAILALVVGLAIGLGAGYLLFTADDPDVNAEVEDISRVEAFVDAWTDAWNRQDLDALGALMTEDAMFYGYRADEEGTFDLAYAADQFDKYTFEASDVLLVHETGSYPVTGRGDLAYDVVEKVTFSGRVSGDPYGISLEYYHLVTDEDGELKLHHASVLDWSGLRAFGL